MAKECVQVKIEIGHKSVCRTETTHNGFTHDWFVFVRGTEGSNISHFVDKVVFYLHESFPKPRRVLKEPPYKLEESGYGSFLLPIEIYFKNKDEPKKVRIEYDLFLQLVGNPPVNNVRVEAITFSDPLDDFKKRLLKAGGVVLPASTSNPLSPNGIPPNESIPSNTPKPDHVSGHQPNMSHASPAVKKPKSSPLPYVALSPLLTPKSKTKDITTILNGSSGSKRTLTPDDNMGFAPKLKKKKVDKPFDSIYNRSSLQEANELSPLDNGLDRLKGKPVSSNPKGKAKDNKERRRSVDSFSSTPVAKKPHPRDAPVEQRQPRGKEIKEIKPSKQEKGRKDDAKSKADQKVQKITMKRTSHDAWSSSLPNKRSILPGKKLENLIADRKSSGSSSDDEKMTEIMSKSEHELHDMLLPPKLETSTTQLKNSKPKRTTKKVDAVSKVNGVKKKETKSNIKSNVNGKTNKLLPSLLDLHKRICSIQDGTTLQKVVDIVGGTGLFEITSSTFDFDLCTLDQDTINRLQCSLSETVS